MQLKTKKHGHWIQLSVHGDIDDYTYPIFKNELDMLSRLVPPALLIDLQSSPFINFLAVKALVELHQTFDKEGRTVAYRMSENHKDIRELMELICISLKCRPLNIPLNQNE